MGKLYVGWCSRLSSLLRLEPHAEKFNRRRLDEAGSILIPLKSETSSFGFRKGQTMVEFALVAIPFFLLLFAIVDYGWLFFSQMNIQQAVDDGARYASTGQETGSGARISSIINVIQSEISVPGVNASNLSICSTPPGGTTASCYQGSPTNPTGPADAAGGPQYTVTISLTTTLPLMTPLIAKLFPTQGYTFTSNATFQNEPFDPSTTK
jgi:Flp pilus assembly protein TadG